MEVRSFWTSGQVYTSTIVETKNEVGEVMSIESVYNLENVVRMKRDGSLIFLVYLWYECLMNSYGISWLPPIHRYPVVFLKREFHNINKRSMPNLEYLGCINEVAAQLSIDF